MPSNSGLVDGMGGVVKVLKKLGTLGFLGRGAYTVALVPRISGMVSGASILNASGIR